MQKDIEGFLKDLSALSLKYNIIIGGCGCCGSPYLVDRNSQIELNGKQCDDLAWTNDDHYEIDIYDTPEELKKGE